MGKDIGNGMRLAALGPTVGEASVENALKFANYHTYGLDLGYGI